MDSVQPSHKSADLAMRMRMGGCAWNGFSDRLGCAACTRAESPALSPGLFIAKLLLCILLYSGVFLLQVFEAVV
jgi:hypothetical protein